jgi:phosphohistidine phosphatase
MDLFIVRHADAGTANPRKYPDDSLRPLSLEGKREMLKIACGMRRAGIEFDSILDSGYVRARQTSECICTAYEIDPAKIRTLEELAPEVEPGRLTSALRRLRDCKRPLLVGHQPNLGRFIGHVVAGNPDLPLELKKAGVCRIAVTKWAAGGATIVAVLPPKVLRKLGK